MVAGGGVADAGGGVAVLGLGLLIAPGVVALPGVLLSGGQLAFALSATVGLALEVAIA